MPVQSEYQTQACVWLGEVGSNPRFSARQARSCEQFRGFFLVFCFFFAVNLETFDAPFGATPLMGSVQQHALTRSKRATLTSENHHSVIWDNAATDKGPDVKSLSQGSLPYPSDPLPPYCPHLNPIERLWAVCINTLPKSLYPKVKAVRRRILAFMRETIPQEWTKFRDKVSDNSAVITHEKLFGF